MTDVLSHARVQHKWYGAAAERAEIAVPASDLGEVALPEAVALLTEVLARVRDVDLPVMQFVAACPLTDAVHVAREFAIASVTCFGRTLLLAEAGQGDADAKESSRIVRSSIQPDGAVAGLYHRRLGTEAFDPSQLSPPTIRSIDKAFRMMVVASAAPIAAPVSLAQATLCHGSILVVAAGVTRLKSLQMAARQIQRAGGRVLGTILFDAPRIGWGWGRRRPVV